MIYNSLVWKEELSKEYENFKALLSNLKPPENEDDDEHITLSVEKFFFISSFIIRKLLESGKLTDELVNMHIPVEESKFNNTQKDLYLLHYVNIDEYYDLNENKLVSFDVKRICNKFIHSFLFIPIFDEETEKGKYIFCGVLVNSDYDKKKALYYVEFNNFTKLIEEVINDEVRYMTYNSSEGKERRLTSRRRYDTMA